MNKPSENWKRIRRAALERAQRPAVAAIQHIFGRLCPVSRGLSAFQILRLRYRFQLVHSMPNHQCCHFRCTCSFADRLSFYLAFREQEIGAIDC